MKFNYVYILLCSDEITYTGITNDVERRIYEHLTGLNKSCFTYQRRPVNLVFQKEFNDFIQAVYFEKKIKIWSGKKKLALAKGQFNLLQILAESRNATHSAFKPKNEDK